MVVACDFLLVESGAETVYRAWLGLGAILLYWALAGWNPDVAGLRLKPLPGGAYWLKATVVLGLVVGGVCAAALGFSHLVGSPLAVKSMFRSPQDFGPFLVGACLIAPLTEEVVYRGALCVPARAALGTWATVALSGVTFAALHVLYGNPAPDNAVAGFVLAWAYLRSSSLAVPIVLHALGNLCVFAVHAMLYYAAN